MPNIDPRKIREELKQKKPQETNALVTGDIIAPAATIGGKPDEQAPTKEAPSR